MRDPCKTAARDAQIRHIPVVLQFGLRRGCFIDEDVPSLQGSREAPFCAIIDTNMRFECFVPRFPPVPLAVPLRVILRIRLEARQTTLLPWLQRNLTNPHEPPLTLLITNCSERCCM